MTQLTYAIGDVHGRLDLLREAFRLIEFHGRGEQIHTVMLGDYVDRGEASRGVVEFLMATDPAAVTCLKGNHEAMMVDAVRGADLKAVGRWFASGGDATMASYGCSGPQFPNMRKVPKEHIDWLASRPLIAQDRHRTYVHAGLFPGRPAEEQGEDTCLWIRGRFLEAEAKEFDTHVVHGHTPEWLGKPKADMPELLSHRTNLDTGAYYTGVLAVGVFDSNAPGGPIDTLRVNLA